MLLLISTVAVAFIIAELGIRTYFKVAHKNIELYRPSFYTTTQPESNRKSRFKSHPFLPYIPLENDSRKLFIFKPETNQTILVDYTQNSLGFRTPERSYQKKENVKRIITLGGSTTWDGLDNDHTWPALLEKQLNQYYKNKKVSIEVINLAVDGAPSAESLVILSLLGVLYRPDLVISYDGVNDFWTLTLLPQTIIPDYRNIMRKYEDHSNALQLKLPRWAFHSYLVSLVTKQWDEWRNPELNLRAQVFKYSGGETRNNAAPSGVYLYERNLRLMRGISSEYGSQFVASIPHWVHMTRRLGYYDDTLRKFYRDNKMNFLDLQTALPHEDYSIHTDQVHWTEKGVEMMANEWSKKIIKENLLRFRNQPVFKNQ